jgi:hypothetical protein
MMVPDAESSQWRRCFRVSYVKVFIKQIDTKNLVDFELEAKFLSESHANIGLLALSTSIQFRLLQW